MSSPAPYVDDSISAQCEDILFCFDEAWHNGEEPNIAHYVDRAPATCSGDAQLDLLAELVMIDLECRWRKGLARRSTDDEAAASTAQRPPNSDRAALPERPKIDDYVERFARLRHAPPDRFAELLAQEYRVRQRWGDRPSSDEFTSRFPELAIQVSAQLEAVDAELAADSDPCTPSAANIAHFELLEVLGEGGMGIVYRALDTHAKREVALKVVRHGRLASPAELARFQAETGMVADLDHPHIVPLYEAGKAEDVPYFSMKLIDGADLSRLLPETKCDVRRAATLVAKVADAVQHAHERGILHRDLKPANILLDAAGEPHVTDFGLAKRIDSDTLRTRSGDLLGTAQYMSPEQAAGRVKSLTTATDVYGLGAVLYAALTAEPPFRGETTVDIQRQVQQDEPRSCRQLNPRVDPDLAAICQKSMEKDAPRRYRSAAEFADDLRRWLAHEPVRARRISAVGRAWRWCRRKPLAATLAGVAAALVLTLAVGVPVLAVQAAYLRQIGFLSAIGEIRQWRQAHDEGWLAKSRQQFKDIIAKQVDPEQLPLVRTEIVATHETFDAQRALELTGSIGDVWSLSFSDDGGTLAGIGYGRVVRQWNVDDMLGDRQSDEVRRRAAADSAAYTHPTVVSGEHPPKPYTQAAELPVLRRHPSGYLAVATPTSKVVFVDPQGKRDDLPATIDGPAPARSLAFDGQGRRLAIGWGDGTLTVHAAASGELLRTLKLRFLTTTESGENLCFPVALSSDGEWLAATHWKGPGSRDVEVRLYPAMDDGTGSLRIVGTHRHAVTSLAFSPDGGWLASASNDYSLKVYELSPDAWGLNDPSRHVINRHAGPIHAVAFSPNGEMLATASHDGTIRFWDVYTGGAIARLDTGWEAVLSLAFSGDGRYLAAGGGQSVASQAIAVYALSPDSARRRLPGHLYASINGVAVHPSGQAFVTATGDDDILVWQGSDNRQWNVFPQLPHRRSAIVDLTFSPGDGALLAVSPRDVINPAPNNAAKDHAIALWNWRDRRLQRLLEGHRANIESRAFDPAGKRFATGDAEGTLIVWNVSDAAPHAKLQSEYGGIRGVAFAADGGQIVSVHEDGHLLVRELPSGNVRFTDVLPNKVSATCFSADGRVLYVGSPAGDVIACTLAEGKVDVAHTVVSANWPDARPIAAIALDREETRMAVASGRQVIVWDLARGKQRYALPPQAAPVFNLAFGRDGDELIVGGRDDLVTVWDLATLDAYLASFGLE